MGGWGSWTAEDSPMSKAQSPKSEQMGELWVDVCAVRKTIESQAAPEPSVGAVRNRENHASHTICSVNFNSVYKSSGSRLTRSRSFGPRGPVASRPFLSPPPKRIKSRGSGECKGSRVGLGQGVRIYESYGCYKSYNRIIVSRHSFVELLRAGGESSRFTLNSVISAISAIILETGARATQDLFTNWPSYSDVQDCPTARFPAPLPLCASALNSPAVHSLDLIRVQARADCFCSILRGSPRDNSDA